MPIEDAYRNVSADALPNTVYIGLFNGDPASGGSELSVGGRQACTLGAAGVVGGIPGVRVNTNLISFPMATSVEGTPTWFGAFTAAVGGTRIARGQITTGSEQIDPNEIPQFAVGQLKIGYPS